MLCQWERVGSPTSLTKSCHKFCQSAQTLCQPVAFRIPALRVGPFATCFPDAYKQSMLSPFLVHGSQDWAILTVVTSLRANVPNIPQPTCSLQQNLIHAHIERNTKSQPYVTKAQTTPRKKIRRNCSAKKSFIILHNVCMDSSWSSFFTNTALMENPNLYTRSSQRIHSSDWRLQT
jgi:hypothetical protein